MKRLVRDLYTTGGKVGCFLLVLWLLMAIGVIGLDVWLILAR